MCLSVRQAGGGCPTACEEGTGPSLPAWLVVLIQTLRRAAHLCEALGVRAGAHAHPAFLWLFDLGQDVPDLPLSQLEDRGQTWQIKSCTSQDLGVKIYLLSIPTADKHGN